MKVRQPRRSEYLFFSLFILLSVIILDGSLNTAESENEFHLSNEFSLVNNNVSGAGSSSSSLTEGTSYLNVLGINGNGDMGAFDYLFNVGVKATDDISNDVKDISLTNLNVRLTNDIHRLNIGDTFESFSQYSLTSALKGVSYRFYNEAIAPVEVTLVYGSAFSRWDSLWRDSKTSTLERQVAASRVKYIFSPDFSTGVSILTSEDDKRFNNGALYDNKIYEFDIEYRPIPGLVINSEIAFNDTEVSVEEGKDYTSYSGYAFKIKAVGDGHPSRVTLEYEKVDPEFTTLLGSATSDREKFKAKWRYKYTKKTTVNTGFLWYSDNLDGQKSDGTTDHYKPEAGITVKGVLHRKYSIASVFYKLDIAKRGSSTIKSDHIVTANYRDRFGLFDIDTNLGYTSYDSRDILKSKEYTFNTSINSRYTAGDVILKPSLYLGIWTSDDELTDNDDRIHEYSIGLGADLPKMKITSNMKAGVNKLDKDVGDDSEKLFASMSVYYRPAFLSKLNYGMLFLRAYLNDFSYTTGSNDFRESSITAGLNIQI